MDARNGEKTKEDNASNSLGWDTSMDMCNPLKIDIPRNTCQAMVLIIFNLSENHYGAFHNEMVINRPIFRAYGNGEYLGISKCLRCVEGWFPKNSGVAAICFDCKEQALKCLESKTQMREAGWMGLPEVYIVPLCNPVQYLGDYQYLQIDMYDVKNGVNFVRYLNTLENMVHAKDGLIIAGTREVMRFRGLRRPMYLVIYQWMHLDQVESFNREATPILRESGSACSTRVIFEMDAYCPSFRR
ncbi:hypothetical protein EGR_09453 [Echinococcus granulosus]|uniref:Uncharacterized protein n=2 Tax=Echinococcus granulosus TaxID=6210 RepID=W6U3L5_ECHGR|nr:hypothetical protein EGR_09453 [Echinococcus granulosus]EUB55693.1 hypothetical protein EGR_09453 [Echinococcus granulosus]